MTTTMLTDVVSPEYATICTKQFAISDITYMYVSEMEENQLYKAVSYHIWLWV